MDWLPIAAFVLLGLIFIIVEVIFVPGTTFVGIAGFLSTGFGIYKAYEIYGNTIGTLTLFASLIISGILFYVSFKNRSWERFSLKETMKGRVNQDHLAGIKEGDTGTTISSLKPIGKALLNDQEVEVRSNGNFVNEEIGIKVTKI